MISHKITKLLNYSFSFIQELEPGRNMFGEIKQFLPQALYNDKNKLNLHSYGQGPFCKFSTSSCGNVSGVYALFDSKDLLYIGQTVNLLQRFNSGYGNISPRNCYTGGQSTNCKINNLILNKYLDGERIFLYFYEIENYDMVENRLLIVLNPPFNGKSRQYIAKEKSSLRMQIPINTKEGKTKMTSKYDPFYSYLSKSTEEKLTLSFEKIEQILGFELPASAHRHNAWWGNEKRGTHSHSRSWQDAGYNTEDVKAQRKKKQMTFIKEK